MSDKKPGQPLVTALLRGLAVLRCFDHGRERLGSSEIARMTGLPQPTVWRLCKTLEHGGYLTADQEGARFRPGLAILTLGYSALDTLELAELARPMLEEIAARFNAAASLSTREGTSMLYVQRTESPQAFLKLNVRAGSQVPIISSGTGWGYLAGLQPELRKQVMQECRKADPALHRRVEKQALAAIAEYPRQGYVTNVDVFFPGLTTVSIPLSSPASTTPFVLICTSATPVFADLSVRAEAGQALMQAAQQLRPVIERLERE
ncbi:MAG: IclR family transcriptional regulator [Hydrogenophaga sp.]|jgi:DNA-binding IclR family transcriptional regulator|uniref:IclR family transcriptional regulator n=1 Tax=Hydrogenophaga sp. TaxID=1904254 RepID=UPI004035D6CA